ncbi:uncharacterized protein CANTADRAFT_90526 [Suhomyces tanzawaensis NRRL Y-17324]|uniref:Protein SQS1 n=1 Tax=Suhomyces tanzawaensis NRRL Y-17324 TaxID=984487 RepID=A0A1E4SIV1_9ASCO|nr:uncharacterized protein CANTADRAFT_90526 [Suhomyces tanzawaensis NRRL Y-17324]ODV79436.1 hypothetical protein CANTADRAFT_90526 [Suhomyces tanzawaensis NRRL Y-17324]
MPRRNTRGAKGKPSGSRGGNFGRFPSKNKKRNRGKSNNRGGAGGPGQPGNGGEFPELMDLNESMHVPAATSMKSMSKRPGRLMQEAMYTERHHGETMSKSFRDRPIEFVKATEIYDPQRKINELLKRGVKGSNHSSDDQQSSMQIVQESDAIVDIDMSHEAGNDSDLVEFEKFNDYIKKLTDPSKVESPKQDHHSTVKAVPVPQSDTPQPQPESSTFKDINSPHIPPENQELLDILNSPDKPQPKNDTILTFSSDSEDSQDETTPENLSVQNLNINEPEFVIDEQADDQTYVEKPDVSRLIKHTIKHSDASTKDSTTAESHLEHDSILTIGKVSLRTQVGEDGVITTQLPSKNLPDSDLESDSDVSANEGYRDYISSIIRDMRENSDDEDDGYISSTNFDIMASSSEEEDSESDDEDNEDDEDEPEYGFLPEDFEFDVSQISVTNVRYGLLNQLYTRNLDLTGSPDTYQWIDQEEVVDYVILKGVKEHRLGSFLKYITGGLIDQKHEEQPDYSDVYISESDEEEEEIDDDTSQEGDDVSDLIAFTKNQKKSFSIEDIQTQSIQTKGKGRKKQLDLDRFDLDNEIRESLQEQFQIHRENKKNRKLAKEDARIQKGLKSNDLLVKYPYTLHIKDIRDEMELFLHDSNRDSMSFPPLDPHGSKVVSRMAKCYNFGSKRCGPNGIHLYVKLSKSRKTFHYLPRYDEIGHILKQRPIFNRTDQKRPKDEITASDGNSKKDKARGRNKLSMPVIKEGDIVGAAAPEIGKDNIGRQLLEKLGWIKGEGLGAHGNRGISEPLMATMKKSKTGLK